VKLWLVVLQDKDLEGEPDVGCAFVEGNELAAKEVMRSMERDYRNAKRCRCVGRYREIERSKPYRAAALMRTRP
jgi:hypothetical protein